MNQKNIKIAFSFLGEYDQKPRFDPKFVRIVTRLKGKQNGENFEHLLSYHECTEEDFADFYPANYHYNNEIQRLKQDKALMCLEWDDSSPHLLYGSWSESDY